MLLLHGIGGSARYWRPLAEVSSGYRATAPDLLGFGRSPRPDDSAYDVQEHLHALLPVVTPGSVVLGHPAVPDLERPGSVADVLEQLLATTAQDRPAAAD